ncbi:hypothetical protein CRM22_008859 [Opisthorchis felineus]|uniref:AB hydrolase-1 domain-containing protein n=1 Tax=Opisthorchis felineus TaxID=147828 RepID=A0A4S2LHE4_OPIFE|nr:hypothetical protein CRM22_008859 [Opisthorchis felineus]
MQSTKLLPSACVQQIVRGSQKTQHGIQRIGLATREGEFVEGFYTDRRTSSPLPGGSNGNYLIVCCEGNGGYPEIGIPLVPLELGYSVLAWNHPGFGSSTGMPFPKQECNAMEAVLLFAIRHLKFKWNEIYLYGWSIGGYTASWAAMNYPSLGGLILDATFDDLDELARRTVPNCLYPLVLATVKQTLDLNNSAQLIAYNGPVRIIRRSDDEIISTSEPPTRASNRANVLLIKLLKHRFPNLMTVENEALLTHYLTLSAEEQASFVEEMNCYPEQHASYISNFLKTEAQRAQLVAATAADDDDTTNPGSYSGLFPSQLGSQVSDPTTKFGMLLYLVSRYFTEAPGTHCAPLSSYCFELPWWPCERVSADTL